MKPKQLKQIKQNAGYVNKWQGYYLEDTDCIHCLYYKGIKHGCTLTACSCEDIKIEAIEKSRIKRKRGFNSWDM